MDLLGIQARLFGEAGPLVGGGFTAEDRPGPGPTQEAGRPGNPR